MKRQGENYRIFRKKLIGSNKKRESQIQLEYAKLEIAEHLAEYRTKKSLTQKQLAQRLGIKQQVVAKIENGSNITLETLIKFLNELDIAIKVQFIPKKHHQQILQFT